MEIEQKGVTVKIYSGYTSKEMQWVVRFSMFIQQYALASFQSNLPGRFCVIVVIWLEIL